MIPIGRIAGFGLESIHCNSCRKMVKGNEYYYILIVEEGEAFYHKDCLIKMIKDDIRQIIKEIRKNKECRMNPTRWEEIKYGIKILNFIYSSSE